VEGRSRKDRMTSTWVVGDIHGCAKELASLLDTMDLQPGDRLLSAGDLFHRGPDPVGVLHLLQNLGSAFEMVLGNHEWALLSRWSSRHEGDDLHGDHQAKMHPSARAERKELLAFLENRPFFLRGTCNGPAWANQANPRAWILVHGSVLPGRQVEEMKPAEIVGLSRCLDRPGAPLWHTQWRGPEFVLFGHAQSAAGMHRDESGTPMAYGLDTGCVYGGKLTAIRLQDLKVLEQ